MKPEDLDTAWQLRPVARTFTTADLCNLDRPVKFERARSGLRGVVVAYNGVRCDGMTSLMTWLVPASGPVHDRLAAAIDALAAEHDAPRFQPHVTMVGRFDSDEDIVARTLESLTTNVPSFDVTFTAIGHEDAYFRALYLRAEPSPQLTALHDAGCRSWALDLAPYMPHLSLLYSNFAEEQKRPIIAGINFTLPLTVHFDAIELWADDHLDVHSWRRVARMSLT